MQRATTDKLMQDLRVVVGDAEDLLEASAGQGGERMQQLRQRATDSVHGMRARLEAAGRDADRAAREAARQVNSQVRAHPWTSIALAAAIGALIGIGIFAGRK